MAKGFDSFLQGNLTNLSRRTPIEGSQVFTPGKVELAEFRTAAFSLFTPHTPADGRDTDRIMKLDAQAAAAKDFELHRRELVVLPLQGTLRQINDNYADHFSSPKKIAEWNQRIADFLVTTYGNLTDYLQGKEWSHALNNWFEIDPSRPEQSALVAGDLSEMLSVLTKTPFSKLIDKKNRETVTEIFGHLQPHMASGHTPPTFDNV